MNITRPKVRIAGLDFKPVSKSAVTLSKQAADDALDAVSAVQICDLFQAIEASETLIQTHEKMLSEAVAAAEILDHGTIPEGANGDLVACAKRIHDLSEALDRPRDIDRERAEDLVAGLTHDLERAKTAQDRAIKRAQYAFAKALVAGCDPSMMSKSSRYAHPPVTFSKFDLDYAYNPRTRVLKGIDREWPAEDTDPDDMRATMVAAICESVLSEHEKQAARKAANERMSDRQRERMEINQAADDLAAQIKGSI
jgi:hypothetical protein